MITTVMFDLDGTLLPFEQEEFIKIYFSELCKKLAPLGYEPEHTIKSVWAGTGMMVQNDGSRLNSEAFWEMFNRLNEGKPDAKPYCDAFYTNEFDKAKACLKYIPNHRPMIEKLKAAGLRLVLATNPIFPAEGVYTRMAWVGLKPEDFELITHYDNSSYCKPNPDYFTDILNRLGEKPENCLMAGNNLYEDMRCAEKAGLNCFLVNEFLENPKEDDPAAFKNGSVAEAAEYAFSLMV